MRTLLKKLFVNHWPRKCVSFMLAIIIWFFMNKSLTTTKTINNIPVRIENIPAGKTVEGIQPNGFLNRKINLTLVGNKGFLDHLNGTDLQVVFDATDQEGEWIATVTRKNLRPNHSNLNIAQRISRVSQQNFIIKLTKLVSDKISIMITQPIGEAPLGYQLIDIWPHQLTITVTGPEDSIKKLKTRGLNLTFNLNNITKGALDALRASSTQGHSDVISFYVPNGWKYISIPSLSHVPIAINDPNAQLLRIDFLRSEMLKLHESIPISLYFPLNIVKTIQPSKINLIPSHGIENRQGINRTTQTLYAKGVSPLFLDIIKDRIEIAIIVDPNSEEKLTWCIQFINAKELEERYLHYIKSDAIDDDYRDLQPHLKDRYLRSRFRNYMNRFELYKSEKEPFELAPTLQGNAITFDEIRHHDD